MAKITDPDLLTGSTTLANIGVDGNIWVDVDSKQISLSADTVALLDTSFVDGGVSLQAVYSWLKEEWKTNSTYIKYPFPMVAITPEQFEFVDDWTPSGSSTIELFRDAGFAIKSAGTSTAEYVGIISLGDVSNAQMYYAQSGGSFQTSNFVLTGAVNQCVQIFGDENNGDYDYRDYFTVYAREYDKLYNQADNTDIGVSEFTYQAYRFPVSNADDLNINNDDSVTSAYSISVTYYDAGQSRTVGASTNDYNVIVDNIGGAYNLAQIYEHIQWRLRQGTDIDDGVGVVSGKTASLLMGFVGSNLITSPGVFIDNISANDLNDITFFDTGNTQVTYPYVAAGDIHFNDNLYGDSGSIYRTFFSSATVGDFGTTTAVLARQNDSSLNVTDISFSESGGLIESTTTDFVADTKILVDTMIEIAGTSNQTSDPAFFTVTAVTANQLSVLEPVVDETAGATMSIYNLISGNINGAQSASFSYDYNNNDQRGVATENTPAPIIVVAIGLDNAQYVKTTGTIGESTTNTVSLVAALERNYSNA